MCVAGKLLLNGREYNTVRVLKQPLMTKKKKQRIITHNHNLRKEYIYYIEIRVHKSTHK
jgi:hypothetical protein